MGKCTEQTILKRSTNAQQTYEEMLNILGPKEMQVKMTLRFYLTAVRMVFINNTSNNKCWCGWGEEPLSTLAGNVN
jgi:hypothetical protein